MARRPRNDEPNLFALRCETCAEQLVPTPSGYLACPQGHGKLLPAAQNCAAAEAEPCGSWFDADE
jgi:hypothetical protein